MIFETKKGTFKYISEPCKEQINWGSNDNPIGLLEIGKSYKGKIEIHKWHSKIILDDYPDKKFNSLSFEEIESKE